MTFVIMLVICVNVEWQPLGKSVISTLGPLRTIFFTLTFFTIGMVSNFHKLMEEASAGSPLCTSYVSSASSFGSACSSRGCSSTA